MSTSSAMEQESISVWNALLYQPSFLPSNLTCPLIKMDVPTLVPQRNVDYLLQLLINEKIDQKRRVQSRLESKEEDICSLLIAISSNFITGLHVHPIYNYEERYMLNWPKDVEVDGLEGVGFHEYVSEITFSKAHLQHYKEKFMLDWKEKKAQPLLLNRLKIFMENPQARDVLAKTLIDLENGEDWFTHTKLNLIAMDDLYCNLKNEKLKTCTQVDTDSPLLEVFKNKSFLLDVAYLQLLFKQYLEVEEVMQSLTHEINFMQAINNDS